MQRYIFIIVIVLSLWAIIVHMSYSFNIPIYLPTNIIVVFEAFIINHSSFVDVEFTDFLEK